MQGHGLVSSVEEYKNNLQAIRDSYNTISDLIGLIKNKQLDLTCCLEVMVNVRRNLQDSGLMGGFKIGVVANSDFINSVRSTVVDSLVRVIDNYLILLPLVDLRREENDRGGNCFYHSIQQANNSKKSMTYNNEEMATHKALRKEVYLELVCNRQRYAEQIISAAQQIKKDEEVNYDITDSEKEIYCQNYIEKAKEEGTWASFPEVKAMANVLRRPIVVVQPQEVSAEEIGLLGHHVAWPEEIENSFPLYIRYNGNDHFEAMVPKE